MLVARIEEWPGGDPDRRRPIARLEIANRSGLAPVSDYEVTLRPVADLPEPPALVYGHVRDDGWLKLLRVALRAIDPDSGFYSSPVTQVPASVLELLPLDAYTSRACQTARAVLTAGPELDAKLAELGLERETWAGEFFRSCRGTEKWTGMWCQDPQHGDPSADAARSATSGTPVGADVRARLLLVWTDAEDAWDRLAAAGMPEERWREVLYGEQRVSSLDLALVAEAFGVTVEWLLSGTEPRPVTVVACSLETVIVPDETNPGAATGEEQR